MFATNVGIVGETVWVDAVAYPPVELDMMGSSFGPTSVVITNSAGVPVSIFLQNSALQGTIFAGSGQTQMAVAQGSSAVNTGWIGVANTTSETGLGLGAVGTAAFGNSGIIEAGTNGSFNLEYGGADPGSMGYVWNTGWLTADPGGTMVLHADGETTFNTAFTGTLLNTGQVTANGGYVEVDSAVVQSATGTMSVANGGTLNLHGEVDGGTIQIQSGMLDFGASSPSPGPYSSQNFGSTLELTGDSATLDFGRNIGVSSIDFNAEQNKLYVNFPWEGGTASGAALQLSGSYTAADFTVSGSQVLYNAHPTT